MSAGSDARDAENPLNIYDLEAGRELLRDYSGVPEKEINSHIETIKEKALKACPYPCIRRLRFLDLILSTTDVYQEVLERVFDGEKFLDLACCFGQEIRKLVSDGAPSENTFGSDIVGEYFPLGYELFKDEDKLRTKFVAADVFDDSSPLTQLVGQMNIIYIGDLFHLFKLEDQEKIVTRVVQLLVAQPGSLVIGRQSGSEEPGEFSRAGDTSGRTHFRHNPESWAELWARVGKRTGSVWSVEAELCPEFKFASSTPEIGSSEFERLKDAKGLRYIIRRA